MTVKIGSNGRIHYRNGLRSMAEHDRKRRVGRSVEIGPFVCYLLLVC
jgi:hypothetical protein